MLELEQDLVPGASTSSTSITAIEQELILKLELDLLPVLVLELAQIPSGTSNLYCKSLESESDLHYCTVFVFSIKLNNEYSIVLDIIEFESPDLIVSL